MSAPTLQAQRETILSLIRGDHVSQVGKLPLANSAIVALVNLLHEIEGKIKAAK